MNTSLTTDEALASIAGVCKPLDTEPVPLAKARTRVLREAVSTQDDMPAFDRSAVDGYAIRLDDPATVFSVVDEIRAGQWKPQSIASGQAVRIFTGAPVPCDGLQVVMQENVTQVENAIEISQRDPDRHIRFRGEDAKKGATLIQPGCVLDAEELSVLATAGLAYPMVSRLPVIYHFVTGDELVSPGEIAQPGQIHDSNSILIQSLLATMGLNAAQGRLPEDHVSSVVHLKTRDAADVLIVSGGASVGQHDYTRRILEDLGYKIHFHGLRIRPGKPLLFASRDSGIAFGLPGNPLAHYVCFHLFVKPALKAMQGLPSAISFQKGCLASPLDAGENPRETYWLAFAAMKSGGFEITPIPWQSSGDITALSKANALIQVPSGCGLLGKGAPVRFLPTRSL
jgi:molybdopterin molybdotransferase